MADYQRGLEDGLDLALEQVCENCRAQIVPLIEALRDQRRDRIKAQLILSDQFLTGPESE